MGIIGVSAVRSLFRAMFAGMYLCLSCLWMQATGQTIPSGTLKYPWAGGMNSCQFGSIDIDPDGINDLVVFDRLGNRIIPFLNDGSAGTSGYHWHPEFVSSFPDLHDWVFFADFNKDGKQDIFTYSLGGIRVFRNISDTVLKFELVTNLLKSWYYTGYVGILVTPVDYPAIADIDGDGDLDILTFFGLGSFVEYHKNLSVEKYGNCDSLDYRLADHCWGNFKESEGSNVITLGVVCPYKYSVILGLSCQENPPKHTGSTLLATDLDGNGTSDLILGDVDFPNLVSLMNGGTPDSANMTSQDTAFPAGTRPVKVFSFPSASFLDINNDGKKDIVVSPFDPALTISDNFRQAWYFENSGSDSVPDFHFMTDRFLINEMIDAGTAASPVLFDMTGDGLPDLFTGNYGYYDSSWYYQGYLHSAYTSKIGYYKNTGSEHVPSFMLETDDFAGISKLELLGVFPAFGDLDGDGDADMLLGNSDGKLILLINTAATGEAPHFSEPVYGYQGIDVGDYSTPQLFDLDKDQKPDLIIGEQNGNLNYYHNTGSAPNPVFTFVTDSLGKINVTNYNLSYSGYSTPCFFTDPSGNTGLLVGSEEGKVHYFTGIDNNLAGKFTNSDALLDQIVGTKTNENHGWRTSPCIFNMSDPVFMDMIVGNFSGGVTYYTHQNAPEVATSIQEIGHRNEGLIKVFPNPADNTVRIEYSVGDHTEELPLCISDLSGKIILQTLIKGTATINISKLCPGIYIVRVGASAARLIVCR